ncbi:MAG: methylated-DNA--[protein]-cysteine S-methyltransferase [Candidatus Thorarchaeota archaeon]
MVIISEKLFSFYNSPIGKIKIISCNNELIYCSFVDKIEKSTELDLTLKKTVQQLDEYFNGKRQSFELNIQPKGTDFQKKVWKELLEIPYGKIITYKELAIKIGNSKAAIAVGNANGKNPISIIIPCHRVIGSDHSLKGYGGGIDKKDWLINFEKKQLEF